jgi:pSer/pThr/pTyr-binding forkhead associated (FHA) protein
MYGELVPYGGGAPIALLKESLVVGRHASCDIQLPSATVSAKHCLLEFREGRWYVRDLGSRNGSRVNGCQCEESWLLPNDVLSIAQHRYSMNYPGDSRSGASETPVASRAANLRKKLRDLFHKWTPTLDQTAALGELVPCEGGNPISLLKRSLLIGRHESCDIVIAHSIVSGKHCNLLYRDGFWFVRDLGSRNGIRVNGVRCQRKWVLPGEILSIAKYRYALEYTAHGDGPPHDFDDEAIAQEP